MKIMVISGSVREGNRGQTVSQWVADTIDKDSRFELDLVKVKDLDLPFYDEPTGGPFAIAHMGTGYKNPKGAAWAKRVGEADAYILVTAEYNHSFPASLKNALDWVGPEWGGKPVSFVSYGFGGVAGERAVMHLRHVVAELGMLQIKTHTSIPGIVEAFDTDGQPKDDKLNGSLKATLDAVYQLTK